MPRPASKWASCTESTQSTAELLKPSAPPPAACRSPRGPAASSAPPPSNRNSSAANLKAKAANPPSLKAGKWQLEGVATTDALTHLVTVCKDTQLAEVAQLLDLPPFNMSFGTLLLGVPDSETRKLLSLITETATKGVTATSRSIDSWSSSTAPASAPDLTDGR